MRMLVAAAVLLAACSTKSPPSVGGIPVGPQRCTASGEAMYNDPVRCRRLTTFARQLLDESAHAPIDSVAVYREPEMDPNVLKTYSGYHDFAIVAFRLTVGAETAFYVRCGVGISETLCFDLRPLKPGFGMDERASNGNPVAVP